MRYYIIAGEASGDLHAANLIEEIRLLDINAEFRGFGGDKMKEQGVELFKHYKETAYMGFVEVALHLRAILNNIELCKKDIVSFNPDCVILVDYPGFNLRIAPFAKKAGLKVLYYISPQLWAWKSSRVEIFFVEGKIAPVISKGIDEREWGGSTAKNTDVWSRPAKILPQ